MGEKADQAPLKCSSTRVDVVHAFQKVKSAVGSDEYLA